MSTLSVQDIVDALDSPEAHEVMRLAEHFKQSVVWGPNGTCALACEPRWMPYQTALDILHQIQFDSDNGDLIRLAQILEDRP